MLAASVLAASTSVAIGAPAPADKNRDRQWHLSMLRIAQAHQQSRGDGITVAVIDTGVDGNHPDLKGNVLQGIDVVRGGSGNGWGDTDGHGTAMAGLIAAHGHGGSNADGAMGIAPRAKILPIDIGVIDDIGSGDAMSNGIREAVRRGAKIISISVESDVTAFDAVQEAVDAGVIIIAAAGNRPRNDRVIAPASYPGVIAVGAVGRDGNIADISTRGQAVVIAAPGVNVMSTVPGNGYRSGSGTSPAAAIVSGVAALIWSKYPSLTAKRITDHLTATAIDKGTPGRDNEYGFGVVNPVNGLLTPVTAVTSPSPNDISRKMPPGLASHQTDARGSDERRGGMDSWVLLGAGVLVVAMIVVATCVVSRRRI
ncbi:type VII secretion-associated serine protease mycosin [Micromonospora echinaurantiaca]|uniref:Type VII secretion-associated serine protease mycosin n=1 Tax=Micromonospora echinaurantiaca TaxID=47857 RepID=A0A1C5IFM7_9ACTN|nr:S8 family serine peptidase [Micromonospora echinaurantiaca]SCG57232.1 type VII secretion-associated serine protease mycosin [Micromonospora echinaurantiaca]